jgi:hypothetical protein
MSPARRRFRATRTQFRNHCFRPETVRHETCGGPKPVHRGGSLLSGHAFIDDRRGSRSLGIELETITVMQ